LFTVFLFRYNESMKTLTKLSFFTLLITCVAFTGCRTDEALGNGLFARISTDRGDIVVRLEFQRTPLTVTNFVALAEGRMDVTGGRRYFDGLNFHRVIANFMIQGGCPQGTGAGGPGYQFPDEIVPELRHDGPGVLSMANAGPGTNGSQFFITHVATPWLDGRHTVFGRVVEGQDVVDSIQQGDRIRSIRIIRNGPAANEFTADQTSFDALLAQISAAEETRLRAERDADIALIEERFPGASISPSGVRYIIQRAGTGPRPQVGQTVQVNYTGSLLSGHVFDSSDIHGRPIEFTAGMGQMILGWDEMVMEMSLGEARQIVIPPELGYGSRGINGVIPPNSFLVFEMELIEIR